MRKVTFGIMLILAIGLISCGKLNVSTNTNIKKNGEATFTLKAIYDNGAKSVINDEIIAKKLGMDNIDINKYTSGDMNVEEITIKAKGIEGLASNENIQKILKYKVVRKDYFYKSIYSIQMNVNNEIFKIKNVYNTKEDLEYINNIPFSNSMSFPGKLISTNADENIGPNEVKWRYKVSDINENTSMNITYEVSTLWKPIGIIIGIIILVIIIIVGKSFKDKRKNAVSKRIN